MIYVVYTLFLYKRYFIAVITVLKRGLYFKYKIYYNSNKNKVHFKNIFIFFELKLCFNIS